MIVFISDLHIPYEHSRAVSATKKFLRDNKEDIDEIILGGDIMDVYSPSQFTHYKNGPEQEFQYELDKTTEFLTELREIIPNKKITYLEGNHEKRIPKFLATQGVSLKGLKCLTVPQLLRLDQLKMEYITAPYIKRGDTLFMHGSKVSPLPGGSVLKEYLKWRSPIVMGHCHRLNIYCYTSMGQHHRCYESGCLQDPAKQEFDPNPNWQLGFLVFHVTKKGNLIGDMATYVNDTMYLRGKRIN